MWEIQAILRGYYRRERGAWSRARWHAFNIMSAIPYCDLRKAGIHSPSDLLEFPWEREEAVRDSLPSDEEIDALRKRLIEENEKNDSKPSI